jgi:hypothetical protein
MKARVLSKLQGKYRVFFLAKLREFGVESPVKLSREVKAEFFTAIKVGWKELKVEITKEQQKPIAAQSPEYKKNFTSSAKSTFLDRKPFAASAGMDPSEQYVEKILLKSVANVQQTPDLRILYTPNVHFAQEITWCYPVVKMPCENALLKLPRLGRTNQKGYKEHEFFHQIKAKITDMEYSDNFHMVIPHFNKPYEPDIVLFDKGLNLYVDIEIDEPYDGYFRYPTHCQKPGTHIKQDEIRDLFFLESGWIVIRFTEKQVHEQSEFCIDYINNVLSSIKKRAFDAKPNCDIEHQWDYNQSIQWQKLHYREKYLGISHFYKKLSLTEIEIQIESEEIEKQIQRTKMFDFDSWDTSIAFDEVTHKYLHPKDETGNAEFISVTTLIERFFPFDLKRYIEKTAIEQNREEEELLIEHLIKCDEASSKGTLLHNQIESFLKGNDSQNGTTEFNYFKLFHENELRKRNLSFYAAEKRIFSKKYNVAGTIDCLFKKHDKDEYVMLDWKRSKKLVIDGHPRLFGFGYGLSELQHIYNSSYYKYCLQQNIYKYIFEEEFQLKISSMKLVVLHDTYDTYHILNVPDMSRESKLILDSLKFKI